MERTDIVMEEKRSGFTYRSFMAILYGAVVLLPSSIWLTLTAGQDLSAIAAYAATLLVYEVSSFYGSRLSKQEVYVIYTCSAMSAASYNAVALILLQNLYNRTGPISWVFTTPTGIPMPLAIPDWFAPAPGSEALLFRQIFHIDFLLPFGVLILGIFLITRVIALGTGFFMYSLYVEQENLPFPQILVVTESIDSFTKPESSKMRVLMLCSLIGLLWGTLVYGIPFVTMWRVAPVPIPWVDLTQYFETSVPGIMFGLGTDISAFFFSFMLPLRVVISMFIGSLFIYGIANPVLVHLFPEEGGLFNWSPGMNAPLIYQWSTLYFWASVNMGLGAAAALYPAIRHPGFIARAFKSFVAGVKTSSTFEGIPAWLPITLFLGGAVALALLNWILIPDLPIWTLLLLTVGGTFLLTLIGARAYGESGLVLAAPYTNSLYMREATIILSGYSGVGAWFAPLNISMGGMWYAEWFKGCDLTGTTRTSWLTGYFAASVAGWLMSFIFVSFFWQMAPIPSSAYPATMIYWPMGTMITMLWVSRSLVIFNAQRIGIALISGFALSAATDLIGIPFSPIGFALGAASPLPGVTSLILGAIVGKILERRLGVEWWKMHKGSIVAGLFLGEGIVIAVSGAIAIILKAMFVQPF